MKSVIISFVRVLYPHTGKRLGAQFIQSVKDMDHQLLRSIWGITTDNAANNTTMLHYINANLQQTLASILEETRIDDDEESMSESYERRDTVHRVYLVACFAHTVQLKIKEGLKQSKNLDVAIGQCRDLVKKITDSPTLLEAFQAVCSYMKVTYRVPPDLDVETRWNST